MSLIDSHCHLKTFVQKNTLGSVLARAKIAGVEKFITVGTNNEDWDCYQSLARNNPDIYYSVGLHPCYVDKSWTKMVESISDYWQPHDKPIALGEIGLDFYHLPKNKSLAQEVIVSQKECFETQLQIAKRLECPVIIHSRDSFSQCIKLIDKSGVNWQNVIFHCFSEGGDEAKQILQRGGNMSFTGNITYKSNLQTETVLKLIGLDGIIIETDSPYLSPEPFRKEKNEPQKLLEIVIFISKCLKVKREDLEKASYFNTIEFFKFEN